MEKSEEPDPHLKNFGSKICFLGSFPPRECGIATFTKDLSSAMDIRFNPRLKSKIVALNEKESFYNYPEKVIMQINSDDIENFIETAKRINDSKKIKLVCVQHEFGLFGGEYGSYLIPFLEAVEKPVVVTFHSVLPNPTKERKKIIQSIASRSSAIIVMAKKAVEILRDEYEIEQEKLHVVLHGVPNVPFYPASYFKKRLRLENKTVLTSFGLLSKGKGIEYVIRALPKLTEKYPNLLYLVIGETHPVVRKHEGEKYRNELIKEVEKLGLKNHVKFYNKYLTLKEIIAYLLASDVYICSNLDKNQIVSGTLSYAMGCGKASISTPSLYAQEMLADERGVIVKLENPDSYTEAIDKILSDKEFKIKLEKNAYAFSREMIWSNVAAKYLNIFNKVVRLREEITQKYPLIKLRHLRNLTDNFGCIQFSKHTTPDMNSGYTVDDNSRALITAITHHNIFKSVFSLKLAKTYLSFLEHTQDEQGKFHNNINNENEKLNEIEYEDALGRAVWSLGYTIRKSQNPEITEQAEKLLNKSINLLDELQSPRAKAFSIIGLCHYCKKNKSQELIKKIIKLADSLIGHYKEVSSHDWHWFEEYLTYSNSKLSEALFTAYGITQNKEYLEIAEKTLEFLSSLVFVKGELSPIGEKGWLNRGGERAFFDQQPVDASSMVQTCLIAYKITKDPEYYKKAVLAFNWFLGKNHLKQMIYDDATGGCYDGLSRNNVNLNQGAESTICYLIARLFLEEFKLERGNG